MIGPLVILLCAAICALWYGLSLTHAPVGALRSTVKVLATLLLAALGLALGAPWLILAALLCGALGDWFLSRSPARGFLPGLGAFLLGHFLYLVWAVRRAAEFGSWTAAHWIAAGVLLGAATLLLVRLWRGFGEMRWAVTLYAALSVALGLCALALAAPLPLFALGVLGFIVSDIILAVQLFAMRRDAPGYRRFATLLWTLYWTGQLGILIGSTALAT